MLTPPRVGYTLVIADFERSMISDPHNYDARIYDVIFKPVAPVEMPLIPAIAGTEPTPLDPVASELAAPSIEEMLDPAEPIELQKDEMTRQAAVALYGPAGLAPSDHYYGRNKKICTDILNEIEQQQGRRIEISERHILRIVDPPERK
jgi:hypothetical protein